MRAERRHDLRELRSPTGATGPQLARTQPYMRQPFARARELSPSIPPVRLSDSLQHPIAISRNRTRVVDGAPRTRAASAKMLRDVGSPGVYMVGQ